MAKPTKIAFFAGLSLVAAACLVFLFLRSVKQENPSSAFSASPAASVSRGIQKNDNFSFQEGTAPAAEPLQPSHADLTASEQELELDALRGNVVVSFGKIEEIGLQAGYILPSLAEMRALAAMDPAKLASEQRRHLLDLQRRYTDLLGVLPEIAGFQNNPAEYGKFFANMARQSAGLSESQASQVDGYMRARANEMIQSGLNEASQPSDPAQMDAWEARRDQFNEQTVAGLRQVLSPQIADRAGINTQLLEFLERDFDKAGKQPGLN